MPMPRGALKIAPAFHELRRPRRRRVLGSSLGELLLAAALFGFVVYAVICGLVMQLAPAP